MTYRTVLARMAVLEFFRTTSALVPAGTSISRTADLDLVVFRERETLILPYLVSNEVEARLSQPICGRMTGLRLWRCLPG